MQEFIKIFGGGGVRYLLLNFVFHDNNGGGYSIIPLIY